MKGPLFSLALMGMLTAGATVLAADYKHPSDTCPTGTHTVTRERNVCTGGGVAGGANGLVVHGSANVDHNRCTLERSKVCRDNISGGVQERAANGNDPRK